MKTQLLSEYRALLMLLSTQSAACNVIVRESTARHAFNSSPHVMNIPSRSIPQTQLKHFTARWRYIALNNLSSTLPAMRASIN